MMGTFLLTGSIFAFLAVAAGAFGAHALKPRLSAEMFDIFEVGARYQMYHALALLAVGLAWQRAPVPWLQYGGYSFIAGVFIFSGSLYLLALTGVRWWGAVTPIGGTAFLIGWVCLVIAFWKQ